MTRLMQALARGFAYLGGLVLLAVMGLVGLSILGRSLNKLGHGVLSETGLGAALTRLGEVPGSYELLESGIAFAIFAFLPLAQITRAHATVDIFTAPLGERFGRAIRALWEVVFALVLIVIAWRLFEGMQDKMRYGETSMLLGYPLWWSYAASLCAACVAALVGGWTAVLRLAEALTGRRFLPGEAA